MARCKKFEKTKLDMKLDFKYAFAKTLTAYRKESGLSQGEVATKAHLTQPCIAQWESASRQPSLFEFYALCTVLEVDFTQFIERVENNLPLD